METQPMPRDAKTVLYGLLSVLGLSFWFFLGFPFANHNESYIWVVQLNHSGLLHILSKGLKPVSTFRPLGLFTAWLGYRIAGGSIYLQQVFNYLVAVLAWLIIYLAVAERRLFAWTALIAGGAFFSGYLYLFHLHGVFYSPLLAFVALLLATAMPNRALTARWLVAISIVAALIALYHSFALLAYAAYILGYLLERRRVLAPKQMILGCLLFAVALVLTRIIVPSRALHLTAGSLQGVITSYRSVELNRILSAVSLLLALVTVLTLAASRRMRAVLGFAVVVFSLIFLKAHLPLIIIWIGAVLLKAGLMGRWRIAFVVASTAALPLAAATGSPTYTVFVIMACASVLPLGLRLPEGISAATDAVTVIVVVATVLVGGALRHGVQLPVVSHLATPILAERERTFQLEEIIAWWMKSDYQGYRLVLGEAARNPVESSSPVERTHRAPTSQDYLDAYVDAFGPKPPASHLGDLLISFGGEKIENAQQVHAVPGRYAGEAIVQRENP